MPNKKIKQRIYYFCQWLVRVGFRLLFGYRCHGRENIPASGPLIVASNHSSYFDPPTVGAAVPRPIHFLGKQELFANPLFSAFIRFFNTIPVRRGGMDWGAMQTIKKLLGDNGALIMFPQGTRRPEDEPLGKPRFGVGMLAQETGAAIVPAFLVGTGRLGDAFLRRRPMRVYYGKPISPAECATFENNPCGQLQLAELVMERIAALAAAHAASGADPAANPPQAKI